MRFVFGGGHPQGRRIWPAHAPPFALHLPARSPLGPDGTFHLANLRVAARVIGHEEGPAPSRSPVSVSTRPEQPSVSGYWTREPCPIELEVARVKVTFSMPGGGERVGRATACGVYFGRFDKEGDHYVSIPHPQVSHDHASIAIDKDGAIFVYDMGSRNGTYVGGVRVQHRTPLGPDGEFYLAEVRVVVEFLGFVSTAPEPVPEPPPPAPPAADVAPPRKASAWSRWWRQVRSKLSGAPAENTGH